MPDRAILDTSVLIALEKLGFTYILSEIYDEVILPRSVADEFGDIKLDKTL